MAQSDLKNGAQIIVDCLRAEGVTHVFGVIGSAILDLLDVIYRSPDIQYIRAQHEQGAAFMADGYARATGKPGICVATCGPGLTNMVSAIAGAFQENSPVIAIAGEIHTKHYGKGNANFHEINQESLLKPITKMSKRVETPGRIAEFMRMAFRVAQSGRKGPVYLGMPRNIQKEQTTADIWPPSAYRSDAQPAGNPEAIDRACELIMAAQSPVILVGGGIRWSKAQADILKLADLLGMPVAVSKKGMVPENHPWSVGVIGMVGCPVATEQVSSADLILALGCGFNQVTTASFTNRIISESARIIQVDIDPAEFGKNYPIVLGITGEMTAVVRQMYQQLAPQGGRADREERLEKISQAKDEWDQRLTREEGPTDAVPINRLRLIRDVSRVAGPDAIISAESGSTHGWAYYGFNSLTPMLEPGDLSCMGSGWCMAMGAKVAFPDRPAIAIIGDGAFMMTLNELASAVDNDIPVVVVVMHNEIYGNVRRKQYEHFNERFAGSQLYIPNLAEVANAFGAYGQRIEQPAEIIPALERALDSGRPSVLDVIVDNSRESLEPPVKLRVKDRY
ncbi:MAG: thiamine pyrophosphate-binding protein [Deltaproteobacteria bacterium]|jgi:thiamine pyrophosphate-dependent acetolactate synthase large subunit-like protein|nr:thiamine pyrophosphate-binding protein [Deltaproteobacteria bacterium]